MIRLKQKDGRKHLTKATVEQKPEKFIQPIINTVGIGVRIFKLVLAEKILNAPAD